MQLSAWLDKQRMSPAEFARVSGIGHRQLVFKYCRGTQFPSVLNLDRIQKATGGEVTANDFVEQHRRPSAAVVATVSA